MSIRLIRCNNSDPVTPYDDAVIFHSAKGHDYTGDKRGGVFYKVYNGMGYIRDNVNHKFIVKSGMAMLYGRQFEIPQNETIEFNVSSLAGKYCVVYVEVQSYQDEDPDAVVAEGETAPLIDMLEITAKLEYASDNYPSIGNTDLITNRYGTATMELYRFQVNSSGQVGDIIDRRYIYMPGVAEKARMMDSLGVVNNRILGNLVFSDKDMVKHTDHAYYADRATSLGTTGVSVTRNKIDDKLYLPNKGAYLVTTKVILLKENGVEWNCSPSGVTHTVTGLPTTVKGSLIHVQITGSDGTAASGYLMNTVLGGSTSNVNFQLRCNGGYAVGNSTTALQIDITVNNGTATCVCKSDSSVKITGSLYLVLYIAGGGA